MLENIAGFLWVPVVIVLVIVAVLYVESRYKVPSAGQALVITGGKKGVRVLPGSGAFVSPRRKHQFFPLRVMTVRSDDQETQTKTLVPVVVKWTAQLRADNETPGALVRAVSGFADYETDTIQGSLKQTLDGEVRAVVATMTPEQVVTDKESFSTQVASNVQQRMQELGFKLVSLNIADVTDNNGHYSNLAAADREGRRTEAETLTAQANQRVAVEKARSEEISKAAELERDLNLAEKTREVTLRQAAIKAETDVATANADIALQLQAEIRNQDLETRKGEVQVIKEQQRQAAATARREVDITDAETKKQQTEIEAQAQARKDEIEAEAATNVAKHRADAEAYTIAKAAEAEAARVRQAGEAEAKVARDRGEAEAHAVLKKGEAEAEAQRLMAEALAANEGANLKVTLAEIQRDTTIKVYTTVGEAMARVGEHATFIDMGGSSSGDGDLLTSVLGNVPELLKKLDVKSEALGGMDFGSLIGSVTAAASGKSTEVAPHVVEATVFAPDSSGDADTAEVTTNTEPVTDESDQVDASTDKVD